MFISYSYPLPGNKKDARECTRERKLKENKLKTAWRIHRSKDQVTWTNRTSIEGLLAGSCANCNNLLCIRTSAALSTFTSRAYLHYTITSNHSPHTKIADLIQHTTPNKTQSQQTFTKTDYLPHVRIPAK